MVSYNIPTDVIEKFSQKASKNSKVETLAFLVGFKNDHIITVTDLVFPRQKASCVLVEDEGMNLTEFQIFASFILHYIIYIFLFCIYTGIPTGNDMDKDTGAWILNNSPMKEKYGSKLSIVAWVHSHVLGVPCSFSTTDVHSQFTWSKIYPDILGLVFELDREGFLTKYDLFGLTRQGNLNVKKCILPWNQCGKCGKESYYSSFMHFVNWFEGPLEVHDYMQHAQAWIPMVIEDQSPR